MSSDHDSTENAPVGASPALAFGPASDDADGHVYTDAATDVFSGQLAALLGDLDDYQPVSDHLSMTGRDLMRRYYDKHLQDRPLTFYDAPVLLRHWLRADLLPEGRPTRQEQRDHAEEHGYEDPAELAGEWKRMRAKRLEEQRAAKRVDKATRDALSAEGVDPTTEYTPGEIERVHGGKEWARQVVTLWRNFNTAQRGAGRYSEPLLTLTAAQLMTAGATAAEVAEMSTADTAARADARIRMDAERISDGEAAKALSRRITAEREGRAITPPEMTTLTDILAEPDEDLVFRIGDLWPIGGRVLLAAPYKAGKSTTVGNALRSLVDGDPFLGQFATDPVRKVVLIDTELDPRTLRRWLRDPGIRKTDAVSVLSLRGRVASFDILDRAVRCEWVTRLSGADVVILDCLRPVLDALGLSEDKDAGKFLVAFDDMLADAGVGEALVVTHMGHQNERARGDSRLLDWPDALWKIVRDDETSFFSALGRDVFVPEGALSFDPDTRRLTLEGGSRKDMNGKALLPDLLALLRATPGLSGREIEVQLMSKGVSQREVRDALRTARRDGLVRVEPGPRNANLHYPAEGDPLDDSAA